MTQPLEVLNISFGSMFDAFKNDSKTTGSFTIPSASYTTRQLRQYSFDIAMANQLSPTQVYLNWSFESDKWMLLNGNTYVNGPQNFELNVYTSYNTTSITVHIDITNRNTTTTTLNSFSVTGNAYFFTAPW